jgi:hypothetical protein
MQENVSNVDRGEAMAHNKWSKFYEKIYKRRKQRIAKAEES